MLQANGDAIIREYVETTIARPFRDGQQSLHCVTVERVRKQREMERLEAALERKVQMNRRKRLLDGAGEATLMTMLACSTLPPGHASSCFKTALKTPFGTGDS